MIGRFTHLPHGEELHLLSNNMEWSEAELSVQVVVAVGILPESISGKICSSVLVEYIGQAIAAHIFHCRSHYSDGAREAVEEPRPGYIVRVRNLQLEVEGLSAGDTLTVTVTRIEEALHCLRYHGVVRSSDGASSGTSDVLASGDLLVHLPPDSETSSSSIERTISHNEIA